MSDELEWHPQGIVECEIPLSEILTPAVQASIRQALTRTPTTLPCGCAGFALTWNGERVGTDEQPHRLTCVLRQGGKR